MEASRAPKPFVVGNSELDQSFLKFIETENSRPLSPYRCHDLECWIPIFFRHGISLLIFDRT